MYLLSMMSKKHSFQEVLALLSIIALLKNSNYQVFPFKLNVLSAPQNLCVKVSPSEWNCLLAVAAGVVLYYNGKQTKFKLPPLG